MPPVNGNLLQWNQRWMMERWTCKKLCYLRFERMTSESLIFSDNAKNTFAITFHLQCLCIYSLFLRSFSFWLSVAICFSSLFFVRRLQSLTYLYCKVLLLFACYSWKFVTACRDRIGHNGHMNWFCSEKLKVFLMFCAWWLLYQVIRRRRGRRGLAFKWRAPVLFVTFYFS